MNTADALAIFSMLLTQRGNLSPEQEAEATEAVVALVGNALTNIERIADALERIADGKQ